MFKLKYDDFLKYDEATGTYSMPDEQRVRDETERNRWKNMGLTLIKDWRLYLMLVPMIFVYICWKYMPMYELLAAFKTGPEVNVLERDWAGLANFKELFLGIGTASHATDFWKAFRNTFVIAFYGLLFGFPTPIILALFFNEIRSNITRSVMQVCVYLPKFLSTVIVTTIVISLFKGGPDGVGIGVISSALSGIFGKTSDLGTAAATQDGLIYSARYFRAIYIVADLWEHAGYDSIVFFAAVIAVSPTSYEAAQIDGAGKLAQMRYVVIPSILSTVVIMLIMRMGSLLSVGYEKLFLFTRSSNKAVANYEVAVVVSSMTQSLEWQSLTELGIAAEMVNNLIGMILVIGANTIARKASNVSLY